MSLTLEGDTNNVPYLVLGEERFLPLFYLEGEDKEGLARTAVSAPAAPTHCSPPIPGEGPGVAPVPPEVPVLCSWSQTGAQE